MNHNTTITTTRSQKPIFHRHILLFYTSFIWLVLLSYSSHFCSSETIQECALAEHDNSNNSNNNGEQQCRKDEEESSAQQQQGHEKRFKWDLDAKHRCNIKKLSFDELHKKYKFGLPPLYHEPIILYRKSASKSNNKDKSRGDFQNDDTMNNILNKINIIGKNKRHKHKPSSSFSASFCDDTIFTNLMSKENITKTFHEDFQVTLSSSNSFSAHRRTVSLSTYLEESMGEEIVPSNLSNMTWYLFGETYSNEWKRVLSSYCLPPCQTCTSDLSALSFGIGGKGSGVQWHVHGPGFSESIHGRKHWILYPPDQKPTYDPDYTSRYWMEEVYTSLRTTAATKDDSDSDGDGSLLPYECTLLPGEMIYFPDGWHHATINLSKYTAFISTFTTEHGFAKNSK